MRQKTETEMYDKIAAVAEEQIRCEARGDGGALVIAGEGWHGGVVGIVASRLGEKYFRPIFMICVEDGVGKGSARSFFGVNIMDMMRKSSDLLDSWGGHQYAAGFTIKEEKIGAFRERISKLSVELEPALIYADAEVTAAELAPEPVRELGVLEPHGPMNDPPVFVLRGVEIIEIVPLGWGRNVRMLLGKDAREFPALFFGAGAERLEVCEGDTGDALFSVEAVTHKGKPVTQFLLHEMSAPEGERRELARQLGLFERLRSGGEIPVNTAPALLPERRDYVALLRHLRRNCGAEGRLVTRVGPMCRRIVREERVREGYARLLVCLEAFSGIGRLSYTLEGDALTVTLGDENATDLRNAPILIRLRQNLGE